MGVIPTPKFYGDRPVITGDRQVPTMPCSKAASPPIQTDRWFRNEKAPDSSVFSSMNEAMNQSMIARTKEVFSNCGILGAGGGLGVSSAGVGSRARWRLAFHTSPYTHALFCRAFMYPQSNGFNSNSYAKLEIYSDVTESTLVASTKFYYGVNPLQTATIAGWQYMKVVDQFVDGLSADTDYFGVVSDVDNGLIQSIAIADLQSMSENYSGYLPQNFTAETPIVDKYRQNLVAPMPSLWKRGGAKVLNWTVDAQGSPRTTTSVFPTAVNVIDGASTTYGSSIPGFTLDMTGKARLSEPTGVPCKMVAYLDSTSANNGRVQIRDSAGTVIAACNYLGGPNVPKWFSTTFNLPATSAKYYLTMEQTIAAATIKVYAVSIFEYA